MAWPAIAALAAGSGLGAYFGSQGQDEQKLTPLPRSKKSKAGENYLYDLMINGPPNIPVQQVADLTPVQQYIMASMPSLVESIQKGGQQARDLYGRTLSGDYDPATGPEYTGYRAEADRLRRKTKVSARQSSEQLGGLKTSGATGVESGIDLDFDSMMLNKLGQLYGQERGYQFEAARGMGQATASEISNLSGAAGISDAERANEQARNNAAFQAAYEMAMMPFREIANIAQGLMTYEAPTMLTGGGMSSGAQVASVMAPIFGGFLAGGGFQGPSGGVSSGPRTHTQGNAFPSRIKT